MNSSTSVLVRRLIKRPGFIISVLVMVGAAFWARARAARPVVEPLAMAAPAASPALAPVAFEKARRAVLADSAKTESVNSSLAFGGHKLIRSADVRLQVRDVALAARRADSVAKAHSGFLAESHISQTDRTTTDARVVIQVPANNFDAALGGLRQLGSVRNENVGTGDVTREYTDLETRLTVTEETASRLRALLLERTGKLSDVLQVERELSRVVTELEQMKGQRRSYDGQIAMSTISITFFESTAAPSVLATLRASVADSMQHLTDVLAGSIGALISLIAYLVPWAMVGAFGWWCVRAVRRAY